MIYTVATAGYRLESMKEPVKKSGHRGGINPALPERGSPALKRARANFVSLGRELEVYLTSDAIELSRDVDRLTGWTSYSAKVKVTPPDRLGSMASEVAHELRAALDSLMPAHQGEATCGRRFPIFLDSEAYFAKRADGTRRRDLLLAGLDAPERAIIDSLQPYHRTNPGRDPLALLKALEEVSATETVKCTTVILDSPSANFEEREAGRVKDAEFRKGPRGVRTIDGSEVFAFRLSPDPEAPVKVDIDMPFDLRYDPPGITTADLDRVRQAVEGVVERFQNGEARRAA
jgi:hypothetical protein